MVEIRMGGAPCRTARSAMIPSFHSSRCICHVPSPIKSISAGMAQTVIQKFSLIGCRSAIFTYFVFMAQVLEVKTD